MAIAEADAILMVVDGRAGLRAGDAELARTLRASEVPVLVVVNKADRPNDYGVTAEFHSARARRPARRLGHARARHRRPARRDRRRARRQPGERRGRRRGPGRGHRPPERRQVLDGERLPRLRPGDRLRHGGDHPRRDRHRARGRRPPRDPRRHRRAAPPRQGRRDRRLLRPAALRTGGRARRRGDRRLRCRRGGHLARTCGSPRCRCGRAARPCSCSTSGTSARPTSTTRGSASPANRGSARRSSPPAPRAAATSARCCRKRSQLADRAASRIPTPELNKFVAEVVGKTPPPAKRGRRLRLYYAAQVGESPPRIAIQVNDRKLISRDWAYHLENRMREAYEMEGVPLIIDFVPALGRPRSRASSVRCPGQSSTLHRCRLPSHSPRASTCSRPSR